MRNFGICSFYSRLTLKTAKDLREYFSWCKADDEAMLAPDEEENATARKIDRKDWLVLELIDYKIGRGQSRAQSPN